MGDNSISEADLRRLTSSALLSKAETIELAGRIADGDEEAFRRFLEANQRLVVKWASTYSRLNPNIELADAISEGNIGLMKAIRRFDPAKGYAFSTYATWWIRSEIQTAIAARGRLVRVPGPMIADLRRIHLTLRELGMSVDDLQTEAARARLCEAMPCTMRHLLDRMRWLHHPVSLDAPVGVDESGSDRYDMGCGAVEPDDSTVTHLAVIDAMRAVLKPVDVSIMVLRFGLDGAGERRWQTVAEMVGMQTKTVEARGKKAMQKLAADQSGRMREVLCA